MSEVKSFASLEPRLLARKGGAKPAMRAQVHPFTSFDANAACEIDDLGWNDMGLDEDTEHHSAEVLPLTPLPTNHEAEAQTAESAKPAIRRQQEEIASKLADSGNGAPRSSALKNGRRAAFTLRVDAERHLKLRLACTIKNLSAQQIVTEALDKLLDEMPELEALAKQVEQKKSQTKRKKK